MSENKLPRSRAARYQKQNSPLTPLLEREGKRCHVSSRQSVYRGVSLGEDVRKDLLPRSRTPRNSFE